MFEDIYLADIESLAAEFAARHLDQHVDRLRPDIRFSRKQVNDAIWGTTSLSPIEVALIDSPLLQRLRYVRQLGVVHWVYPGAIHTRFEHTLGVLYQMQQLVAAINSRDTDAPEVIDPSYAQILRLCAILHDVGHAAFSHVSEHAIEKLQGAELFRTEFATELRTSSLKQTSEIIAYYIVRSPAMERFLQAVLPKCDHKLGALAVDLPQMMQKIADALIGKPIHDTQPLLHELISGPFDADKLDYYARDARLAGTPSVLDNSRLIQKLAVRELSEDELPEGVSKWVKTSRSKYWIFGMKWSGSAVLDELSLARVLLFAKIYRHPKVIAIEQMLAAAITNLAKVAGAKRVIAMLYRHPDDALLAMDTTTLAHACGVQLESLDSEARTRLERAQEILSDVRERRLWERAFQVESTYPEDPRSKDNVQSMGLGEFFAKLAHPTNGALLKQMIVDEVFAIQQISGGTLGKDDLDGLIMPVKLGSTPGSTQINKAYLLPNEGRPVGFMAFTASRPHWADAYLTTQPKGYIFAPHQIADAVYVATEKVLRRDFKVILPDSAIGLGKRSPSRIDELKRRIATSGFYHGTAHDIRPLPHALESVWAAKQIRAAAELFSRYQSPDGGKSADMDGAQHRVRHWLRQFEDEVSVDCALRLLSSFKMLERQDLVAPLRAFIDAHPEYKGAIVVPIGELKDSGTVASYFHADLLESHVGRVVSFSDLADSDIGTPIIMVDDFVGSGSQVEEILTAGFGVQSSVDLNEKRGAFSDPIRELLLKSNVAFVFAAAWKQGLQNVERVCADLSLKATVYAHVRDDQLPFAFDKCLSDVAPENVERFRARCEHIGRQLLESSNTAPEKIEERYLGYGNRAMLVASLFNVPSQTMTAVWSRGTVDGTDWQPLLLRRKKI